MALRISDRPQETSPSLNDYLYLIKNPGGHEEDSVRATIEDVLKLAASAVIVHPTGLADHLAIQTAIDALPATGGIVALDSGTFDISGTITIAKSGVFLEGRGESTILRLTNSGNVDVITLGDGTNTYSGITIRDLLIDGNLANQGSGGHGINIKRHVVRYRVEDCLIKNTVKANIYDDNKSGDADVYGVIKNNYLDTTKVNGQWANIEGVGNRVTIDGNTLINGDYGNVAFYNGRYNVIVVNNLVSGGGAHGRGAISNEGFDEGVIVANNTINNPPKSAISFSVGWKGKISGNSIVVTNNPTTPLIDVAGGCHIADNSVLVSTGNTAAVTAIRMTSSESSANNNKIEFRTAQAHVGINANSSYLSVVGNTITATSRTTGSKGIILGVSSRADDNLVVTMDIGVDVSSGALSGIVGNHIFDATIGVKINISSNIAITGNVFEENDNFIASTSDSYSSSIAITGNTFNTAIKDGIVLRSCEKCSVTGNTFINGANHLSTVDTYSVIILQTVAGSNFSRHNTITGNTMRIASSTAPKYGIREGSANDGPNLITSNVALDAATANISAQHANTVSTPNITA